MMSANKLCSSVVFRSIVGKHGYVTQAANSKTAQQESVPRQGTKVTKLPNGVTVTSVENYAPVSKIALYVKAGSRYESNTNLGLSHALRNLAGSATANASAFGITRNVQQIGASLQTTSTREHMIYTLDCLRDNLDIGVKFLSEVALRPIFKPWEVSNSKDKLKLDIAMKNQCPSLVVLDLIHKAAYRTGLGNSLYCPEYMAGKHSLEMLKSYVDDHFGLQNLTLVGMGIEHDQLLTYADKVFQTQPGQGAVSTKSTYCGDELRIEGTGDLSYTAVVTEGASLQTSKELLCLALLQQVLGTGPHVKWGNHDASRLSRAASKVTDAPHAVSSININYSDSGLFGFYVAAQASEMDKVLKAVVAETSGITKQGLTDQEIKNAKKQLKAKIHLGMESSENLVDEMVMGTLYEGVGSSNNVDSVIDNLTSADIMSVAKKVITGKPSMAAVGNLTNTPYLDQL